MNLTFYVCEHCGNLIQFVENKGVPVMCCGQKMTALTANTTDAAQEKHVPVVKADGRTVSVCVGSAAHPMTEEHSIKWVALQTKEGCQIKMLSPNAAPEAQFCLSENDSVEAVYAYCNIHGLWRS